MQRLIIAIDIIISCIAVIIGLGQHNPADGVIGGFVGVNLSYWTIMLLACWVYDGSKIQKERAKSEFHKMILTHLTELDVRCDNLSEDVHDLAEMVNDLDGSVEVIKDVLSNQK